MAKYTPNTVVSGYNSTTSINDNFSDVADAIENTLSRDGTSPNQMEADLDMNGYRILNQGSPLTVDGLVWKDAWNGGTAYVVGDIVSSSNVLYICILAHTNQVPPNATYWQVFLTSAGAGLPTQTGHTNKLLTTNGTTASWVDTIAGTKTFSGAVTFNAAVTNSVSMAFTGGNLRLAKGTDRTISASSTVTISTGTIGNYYVFVSTGAYNVTGLYTGASNKWQAGTTVVVRFDCTAGVMTLVHDAGTFPLPTSANIATATGDWAIFVSEGTDVWRCAFYQRASGEALTGGATAKVSSNDTTGGYLNGKLVADTGVTLTEVNDGGNESLTIGTLVRQVVTKDSTQTSTTATIAHNGTPTSGTGVSCISGGAYTMSLKSTSSRVLIQADLVYQGYDDGYSEYYPGVVLALFRGTTLLRVWNGSRTVTTHWDVGSAAMALTTDQEKTIFTKSIFYVDSPASTSPSYDIRIYAMSEGVAGTGYAYVGRTRGTVLASNRISNAIMFTELTS